MLPAYQTDQPARADVDALHGDTVLEFGANWCGICRAATPDIAAAMAARPGLRHLRHLRVEDGPGRPLGRSFGIKLWPTLVVLRDGRELARVVRPADVQAVTAALQALDT